MYHVEFRQIIIHAIRKEKCHTDPQGPVTINHTCIDHIKNVDSGVAILDM
jgi:hypothetical protein